MTAIAAPPPFAAKLTLAGLIAYVQAWPACVTVKVATVALWLVIVIVPERGAVEELAATEYPTTGYEAQPLTVTVQKCGIRVGLEVIQLALKDALQVH